MKQLNTGNELETSHFHKPPRQTSSHGVSFIHSEVSKLSSVSKSFLIAMIKNGFKGITSVSLKEDNPSSNLIDWSYVIKNKIFLKCRRNIQNQ